MNLPTIKGIFMPKPVKRIAVTGGAGQIAYSLLFRIANGDLFGNEQPIALHILDLPIAFSSLEGVKMELDDCAFPLLSEIRIGTNPYEIFENVDWALLVGAKPRGPGMERADLLSENGKIFIEQGKALNESANKDVKVLVVGNPCNTNCLIAMTHAPRIPRKNFHAMTRLDQNRAEYQLAAKGDVEVRHVTNMTIWGNHSMTQVPDFYNARIDGRLVPEVIKDREWLEKDFTETVQKRGAAIINARGKSSAASAANAAIDAVRALCQPTPEGQWFSSAVCSDGNSYGIEENLIFSFPCKSKGNGDYEIVENVSWNDYLRNKIKASENELAEERDLVQKEMIHG